MEKAKLSTAVDAVTVYANIGNRQLAYRSVGSGAPIVLCNRFRGTLGTWDPLFLDALAAHYTVITFDYTGIGSSTGELPLNIEEVARDIKDIAGYLGYSNIYLLGWSYGGFVAQAVTFLYPELIAKTVLLGTSPPGKNDRLPEPAFLDTALKPVNDFEDELILFFKPDSAISRSAAEASHQRISQWVDPSLIPATPDLFNRYFAGGASFKNDPRQFREQLSNTTTPILIISGDYDISNAVENWFPLVRKMTSAQFVVLPQTGHAPQHQYPEMVAGYIHTFLQFYHL